VRSREEVNKPKITRHAVLAHQSHQQPICTPHDVFYRQPVYLCDRFPLLDISRDRAQNEAGGVFVKDLIGLYGQRDSVEMAFERSPMSCVCSQKTMTENRVVRLACVVLFGTVIPCRKNSTLPFLSSIDAFVI
jgi:hypothetical protein